MKKSLAIILFIICAASAQNIVSVEKIAQLTGQPSLNNTGNVNVYGTDLGSMFSHSDGRIYFLFGDTFGAPGTPASSGDWRSNTMAYTTDFNASDGITFDGWITDTSGQAKALITGNHDANDGSGEVTKIPTAGWSAGDRQFIWFMSISKWGTPGNWDVNYAAIAYSDDDGNTWTISNAQWPGDSNFIQVSVTEHKGYLLFWGIPSGRFGGVSLARVTPSEVLNASAYEYFTGTDWSTNESDGTLIVNSPVGEHSVLWNPYLQRWIMMYLNESIACIEIRQAEQPQGPWSAPTTVVCGNEYPALYGAYMHPRYMENNGETIYFTMSQYGPYNVFLMKMKFEQIPSTVEKESLHNPPTLCKLYQNYPNPFNLQTRVSFDLLKTEHVKLNIYNAKGQQIRTVLDKEMPPGQHTAVWDGLTDDGDILQSGIFFYRMTAGDFVQTRKAILVK